jgi:hypothetical protein
MIEFDPDEIDSDKKDQGNIPDTSQSINGIPSEGEERNPT